MIQRHHSGDGRQDLAPERMGLPAKTVSVLVEEDIISTSDGVVPEAVADAVAIITHCKLSDGEQRRLRLEGLYYAGA